jgi:hypothetical protein
MQLSQTQQQQMVLQQCGRSAQIGWHMPQSCLLLLLLLHSSWVPLLLEKRAID